MKPANALKERKQINGNTMLLLITIVLFVVLYAAGCVAYADKGFTTLQTFLNVFRSNAGLICVAAGMTCVMLTGGIDISVGSLIAMDCMIIAYGLNNWGWASAPTIILLVLAIGMVGALRLLQLPWGAVTKTLSIFLPLQLATGILGLLLALGVEKRIPGPRTPKVPQKSTPRKKKRK